MTWGVRAKEGYEEVGSVVEGGGVEVEKVINWRNELVNVNRGEVVNFRGDTWVINKFSLVLCIPVLYFEVLFLVSDILMWDLSFFRRCFKIIFI